MPAGDGKVWDKSAGEALTVDWPAFKRGEGLPSVAAGAAERRKPYWRLRSEEVKRILTAG